MLHTETILRIRQIVRRESRLFSSASPRSICQRAGIWINHMHLGSSPDCITGFITRTLDSYCITVNCDLSDSRQDAVLAHTLGHYFLGHMTEPISTFEERPLDYFPSRAAAEGGQRAEQSDMENEATAFAAELLLASADMIPLFLEYPISELSRLLDLPAGLLECKRYLLYHGPPERM